MEFKEVIKARYSCKKYGDRKVEPEKLNAILAEKTGQSLETIAADTERDNYMTAEEAAAYGLIDQVVEKR